MLTSNKCYYEIMLEEDIDDCIVETSFCASDIVEYMRHPIEGVKYEVYRCRYGIETFRDCPDYLPRLVEDDDLMLKSLVLQLCPNIQHRK